MKNIHTDLNEISAFAWLRATETKQLTWLLIDKKKGADEAELIEAFKLLNAQLIDELGIGEDYLNYLHKLRAYNIAKAKWLISQDNFDFSMMKVAEVGVQAASKNFTEQKSKYSDKINAERILGVNINLKEVSAVEYYVYLKEADKVARSLSAKK